ncbi:MAG: hypothetical protein Harvfovirus1_23 [Harvfovirus sp.]|uniref:Uncharacterized protein n=1 Tax=Harvfovirus sp. TaxID=2487768 RepID=A0A3G4ZZQ5_9VIRU|nr:MAG: hypothetical protein Harvfovirus1_23 [Harvfovirus sp.]
MTELIVKENIRKPDRVVKGLFGSIIPAIKKIGKKPLIFDMNDFCPELESLDMLDASLVIEMLDHYEDSKETGVQELKRECVESEEVFKLEIPEEPEEEALVERPPTIKKKRDYSFVGSNHKNKHKVKAINLTTNTFEIYESLYKCQNDLGINAGIIKMCCEGLNHVKSGISKKNNQKYRFEYTNLEPTKLIERVRKYKTDEEKRLARNKYTLKYQQAHKEKVRMCQKKYYESHKNKNKENWNGYSKAFVKIYYERNRGKKPVSEMMDEMMNEMMGDIMEEMILRFREERRPVEIRKFDINEEIIL